MDELTSLKPVTSRPSLNRPSPCPPAQPILAPSQPLNRPNMHRNHEMAKLPRRYRPEKWRQHPRCVKLALAWSAAALGERPLPTPKRWGDRQPPPTAGSRCALTLSPLPALGNRRRSRAAGRGLRAAEQFSIVIWSARCPGGLFLGSFGLSTTTTTTTKFCDLDDRHEFLGLLRDGHTIGRRHGWAAPANTRHQHRHPGSEQRSSPTDDDTATSRKHDHRQDDTQVRNESLVILQ